MISINFEKAIDVQLAGIEAQYEQRLGSIRAAMVLADLADVPAMETKKASLRAEWLAVTNEKAAAIMAVLEGI